MNCRPLANLCGNVFVQAYGRQNCGCPAGKPEDGYRNITRSVSGLLGNPVFTELWIREDADGDLQQGAETMGLCAAPELIGMVVDARPDFGDVPGGVEFCWVRDTSGIRDFVNVAADGFREEAPGLPDLIRAIFSERASLVASDTAAFVVRYRGEAAATALAMVKDDVAWIGWVATRHHLRGRGLGRLATAQRPVRGSHLEPSWRHWRPQRWGCRCTCVSVFGKYCATETTGRQDSEVASTR